MANTPLLIVKSSKVIKHGHNRWETDNPNTVHIPSHLHPHVFLLLQIATNKLDFLSFSPFFRFYIKNTYCPTAGHDSNALWKVAVSSTHITFREVSFAFKCFRSIRLLNYTKCSSQSHALGYIYYYFTKSTFLWDCMLPNTVSCWWLQAWAHISAKSSCLCYKCCGNSTFPFKMQSCKLSWPTRTYLQTYGNKVI